MRNITVRAGIAALAFAATTVLVGCSENDDMSAMPGHSASSTPTGAAGTAEATAHNSQDVTFAQMMIPHHQQAIEMSDILLSNQDIDPQVSKLAEQIKAAQGPEISTMRGWLTDWGANPSPSAMDHSGHEMGMMSEADMKAFTAARGDKATRLFLTGMIEHHEGAVAMAETETESGQNRKAQKLARTIIDSQQSEIETMNQLLGEL